MKATALFTTADSNSVDIIGNGNLAMQHQTQSTTSEQKENKMRRLMGTALFTLGNLGLAAVLGAVAMTGALGGKPVQALPSPTGDGGYSTVQNNTVAIHVASRVPTPRGDGGRPIYENAVVLHSPIALPTVIGDGGRPTYENNTVALHVARRVPTPTGDPGRPTYENNTVAMRLPIALPTPIGDGGRPTFVNSVAWTCETCPPRG